MNKYLMILIAIVVVGVLIYITGLFPYKLFGPFENPPMGAQPNCGGEYRFQVNISISSVDDFIKFLKNYQFEGEIQDIESAQEIENKIDRLDLANLKEKIDVKKSRAIFSNEKIYSLRINNEDFNDNWPWMINIKVSETGHVSIRHCAGI
jgi:hypothetical protein